LGVPKRSLRSASVRLSTHSLVGSSIKNQQALSVAIPNAGVLHASKTMPKAYHSSILLIIVFFIVTFWGKLHYGLKAPIFV